MCSVYDIGLYLKSKYCQKIKYNGVGNGIMMKRCAGMKISITLKKKAHFFSSKLFFHSLFFSLNIIVSLFSSQERKADVFVRTNTISISFYRRKEVI
jgi:hypothetical protein